MKQGQILIASCNSRYNKKTAEAISRKLPGIKCDVLQIHENGNLNVQTENRSHAEDNSCSYDICFGHSHLFILPDHVKCQNKKSEMHELQYLDFCCSVRHFISFSTPGPRGSLGNHHDLSWPAPLSQLIFQIELLLADQDSSRTQRSPQENRLGQTGKIKLGLHLELGSVSSGWLQEKITSQISQGQLVYYLPLMPAYQMSLISEPDASGSNLSDLLLAIHQNCPPEINRLGVYTQMHPKGYFQFRPPDRADDISCSDAEDLRQLAVMLRQKTEIHTENCAAWIDCRGMPLSTVARLAVLCDCLAVRIPHHEDYAAKTARRELGLLLARLPASCEIIEIGGENSHDA